MSRGFSLAVVAHLLVAGLSLGYATHHRRVSHELYPPGNASESSDYAAAMAHARQSELGLSFAVAAGTSLFLVAGFFLLPIPLRLVVGNVYGIFILLLLSELVLQLTIHVPAIARPGGTRDRGLWTYDSTLGWFHQPHARVRLPRTDGGWADAEINSVGLRGADVAPTKGERTRVLVFGDSFVFGVGVDRPDLVTSRLEGKLAPFFAGGVEVINMGVSGYSTDQELLLFERFGERLQPDIVVLVVCENDFRANGADFAYQQYNKPYFHVDEERGLHLRNVPVPLLTSVQRVKLFLGRESNLWNLARNLDVSHPLARRFRAWFDVGHSGPRRGPHKATRAIVAAFEREARRLGSRFVVTSTGTRGDPGFALLFGYLREQGIPHFDLAPLLRAAYERAPERPWIQQDGGRHWDRDGHDLAASAIASYVRSELFPEETSHGVGRGGLQSPPAALR